MDAPVSLNEVRTRKKPSYPIGAELRDYLRRYRRERELPVTYERLRHFHESHPLVDAHGRNTPLESGPHPPDAPRAARSRGFRTVRVGQG